MKVISRRVVTGLAFFFLLLEAHAQTNAEWRVISDESELRELISGKLLEGTYWTYYFRADGKMGYKQYDFISVREWKISEGGEICMAVFSRPEKIIDCETVEKTNTSPTEYRMTSEIGVFEFSLQNPTDELVNAVLDRAGPE